MKKFLLALVLMILMGLTGCDRNRPTAKEPTAAELDSIRHQQVKDSINRLDTIRVLKTLFMGMSPAQFDSLIHKANNFVKIGNIVFDTVDTLLYHGVVHNVRFKGRYNQTYISDMDEMARYVKNGEDSFYDVIKNLSVKYGKPSWISRMSEIDNNGYQFGIANWDFENFSVNYEQKQWARLRNDSFDVEATIEYSIPRIETREEKHRTDSIVNEWKQKQKIEEKRNKEAIQSL